MTADARPDGADRLVWTVRADDPWTVIERPDRGHPDTAESLARRVAAEQGLRLEHVIDTDARQLSPVSAEPA